MKRSTSINLTAMQKQVARHPLTVAMAATITLTGCSETQDAAIYKSAEDCVSKNPGQEAACQTAYENSEKEAVRTAPKYRSLRDCEYDFGYDQCHNRSSSGVFMPLMGGFMLGQMMNSSPVFTSYSRRSRFYGDWIGADGRGYGSNNKTRVRVDNRTFEKKPAVRKTISRGGFGSRATAKSSWSGRSSSGWGG